MDMLKRWALTTFVCAVLGYCFTALRYLNLFRQIDVVRKGRCRRVDGLIGPEDLVLTRDGELIVSCDGRSEDPQHATNGAIILIRPGQCETPHVLWDGAGRGFHPHGIDLFLDPDTGEQSLFVIDHRGTHDAVMNFRFVDNALMLQCEISVEQTISLNDLVAVSSRAFYVTSDHSSKRAWVNTLCDYLRWPAGYVLYFDGSKLTRAASGICYANGIAMDRNGRLYVASMLRSKLIEYERLPTTGRLRKTGVIALQGSPDNITLADDGGLVVAVHPKILALSRQRRQRIHRAPSMVLHVSEPSKDGVRSVQTLFADPGERHCAASAAVKTADRLFVGSVYDDHLCICDLSMPRTEIDMTDKVYAATLKRIFVIESLGVAIYSSMADKACHGPLRATYLRLAKNEARMVELAAAELHRCKLKPPLKRRRAIVVMASALFRCSPLPVLQKVLSSILSRAVFSRWHARHRNRNELLWDELLAHESLQHELLGLTP